MNFWKELHAGQDIPEFVNVVVEIPKGSRNKFEYDKERGVIRLNRVLYSSIHYPGDYGFIPQTYYEDDDPLDILVMVNEPTFPGCIIQARPIGFFRMKDRDAPDDKILAVPASDPLFADYHDISDIPQHFLQETGHFFAVYKDLEGVNVKTLGWENAKRAKERIMHAVDLYQERFGQSG